MAYRIKDGKKVWVAPKRPKVLKGKSLQPNAAAEAHYHQRLTRLIRRMTDIIDSDLKALFKGSTAKEYFAQDASISAEARILMNALIARCQGLFDIAAKPLAERVASDASKSSAASLKHSIKELSQGLTLKTDMISGDIKDILSATVTENVGLIKSIPSEYLTQVQGAVMRSITQGRGLADLVPFLRKQEDITLRRARIIARDQTRKAFSNLNFARMDKIGIEEYEWLHSAGGQKPRQLHVHMSGNIYRIDKPPIIDEKTGQRGKPGDLINCRCTAIPVVKFNEQ